MIGFRAHFQQHEDGRFGKIRIQHMCVQMGKGNTHTWAKRKAHMDSLAWTGWRAENVFVLWLK